MLDWLNETAWADVPWDIALVPIVLALLEPFLKKDQFIFPSPVFIWIGGFMFIYGLPTAFVRSNLQVSGEALNLDEILNLTWLVRLFLHSFTLTFVAITLFSSTTKLRRVVNNLSTNATLVLLLTYGTVWVYQLSLGLGWDPDLLADRALHPRSYTYIISGTGPVFIVKLLLQQLTNVVIILRLVNKPKSFTNWVLASLAFASVLLGGSKLSFLLFVMFGLFLLQKQLANRSLRTRRNVAVAGLALFCSCFLLAFILFSKERLAIKDVVSTISTYTVEAYYTARVAADYPDWGSQYIQDGAYDAIVSLIPRALWPTKPKYGFWQRYWQPRYEPDQPDFHTTTFGCLAESLMLFGPVGPLVYGIIWAVLVHVLYYLIANETNYSFCFFLVMSLGFEFFFFRGGFLFTTPFYLFAAYVCSRMISLLPVTSLKLASDPENGKEEKCSNAHSKKTGNPSDGANTPMQ